MLRAARGVGLQGFRKRCRPVVQLSPAATVRLDRRPPAASPLDRIQPDGWLAEHTTELMNVLHVLGRLVALEPRQADLLNRIGDGPLLSGDELRANGAFVVATSKRGHSVDERQGTLLGDEDD